MLQIGNVTEDSFLGWLNPDTNEWVNAVEGNIGGFGPLGFFAGNHAYDAANDFNLGTYGVDTASHSVWAVLNHNSEFATIPEPSTVGLVLLAGAGWMLWKRRKGVR